MDINQVSAKGVKVLQAQIEDDFEGFDDEMLFILTNGQYWIQSSYKYWYHYSYRPYITIYKVGFTYYLNVNGTTECAEVKQLSNVETLTIVSDFTGWSGNTIFAMSNGQVWQQSEYAYQYNYAYRPTATIYHTSDGYKMQVGRTNDFSKKD